MSGELLARIEGLARAGDFDRAGREALALARDASLARVALPFAIRCATALLARGAAPPPARAVAPADPSIAVSFVVCSIDPAKLARFRASAERQFAGSDWELIHVPDARSLCEGFARGFARTRGRHVVFCHDDIELIADDFRARLIGHLDRHDVVGVAGTTKLMLPVWFAAGAPHIHYWVTHRGATLMAGLCGGAGPVVANAQGLDGVFIAARREAVERLGFDAATFDGFHLYDLDFSYRAHRAGLSVAIALDLLLIHDSSGGFSDDYKRYAARFAAKFPELAMPAAPPPQPVFHSASFDRVEHVRAFYRLIESWCVPG